MKILAMNSLKDTISNLTLIGSNPNLGNKSFLDKRDNEQHAIKIESFI